MTAPARPRSRPSRPPLAVLPALAALSLLAFAALALPGSARAENCPNAAYRSGPSASLPDCRVYEMVSPLKSEGGNVYAPTGGLPYGEKGGLIPTSLPFAATADGNAVAYAGDPTSEGSGEMGWGVGNTYVATRGAGGGWTAIDQQPPGRIVSYYKGISRDLSVGVLGTSPLRCGEEPVLAVGAPSEGYPLIYSHETGDRGSAGYRALLTVKPPERKPCSESSSSLVGSDFGTWAPGESEAIGVLFYAGGTPDLSHVLFYANDALTAEAPPTGVEENNLYENVAGRLRSVNVLPGASVAEPDASLGSPWEESRAGEGHSGPPDFSHVISSDGSRIFWTDLKNRNLYLRENGAQTVQVDAAEPGCSSCESGGGWYWTASGDGHRAFFTDCARLTADSTAVPGDCGIAGATYSPVPQGNDLYEWDEGRLADLTVDENASEPLGADVQGVIGASEDGEYVYFVAGGVLAGNENSSEEAAQPGAPNLYVRHEGATTFIATLVTTDNENGVWALNSGITTGHSGDWQPGLVGRTAEVTPNGSAVVFMSTRRLTGYENAGHDEVYVYEAEAGRLFCASCNPTGAPPTAARAPSSFLPVSANASYLPRLVSNDGGRVFFETVEPLVSQDVNGDLDVYEWERDGVGSCQREAGCVYLISGDRLTYGENTEGASALVGTSASGEDVFFVTRNQLSQLDRDELVSLYDARVNGVQPPSLPICTGSGCQGVPSPPPLFATPPSVTFDGTGNLPPRSHKRSKRSSRRLRRALRACARRYRHDRRHRRSCVRKARVRLARASRASRHRRRGGRHA